MSEEEHIQIWKDKLKLVNKLSYCREMKNNYKLAPYLLQIRNLQLKKDRYRQKRKRLKIANLASSRTHTLHSPQRWRMSYVMTECSQYKNIRETYFSRTEDICPEFIKMKREDKSLLGEIGEYKDLISQCLLSCHILR